MIGKYYSGAKATGYEAHRRQHPKWKWERSIMVRILDRLRGEVESVIDAPVGTGRFLNLYRVPVTGLDYSKDMLSQAREKVTKATLLRHNMVNRDLSISADLVVCFRFLNLLDTKTARRVLGRLLSAACKYAVFTVRTVEDDYAHRMSVGRVFLHRKSAIEKTIEQCGFEIVRRHLFKDAVPGNYDIVLCKRIEEGT